MKKLAFCLAFIASIWPVSQVAANTCQENFDASTSLPADWSLLGGTFYTYDTGEYASYYMNTDADYSRSRKNSICCAWSIDGQYLVTPKVTGNVTFYIRAYRSKRAGGVHVFRCDDGGSSVGEEITSAAKKWYSSNTNTSWQAVSFNLGGEGMRLAIKLERAYLDDFEAELFEEGEEIKALSVTAVTSLMDKTELLGDGDNQVLLSFQATVKNVGTVDLTPDLEGYSISLLNAEGVTLETVPIPEAIATGESLQVTINKSLVVNSLITGKDVHFTVRENFTQTWLECPTAFTITAYLPEMKVYDADPSVGYQTPLTSDNVIHFGNTCEPASTTLYVRNPGNAPLTIPTITVPESFSVSPATLTVEAGQTATITVTMDVIAGNYGAHEGYLVLSPNTLEAFQIQVSGVTRSAETLYVDFNNQKFPDGWTFGDGWRIDFASYGSTDFYALQYQSPVSSLTPSSLVSPKLTVEEGETLQFRAKAYDKSSAYKASLTVAYSPDRAKWTTVAMTPDTLSEEFQYYSVSEIPEGEWYVRFKALNAAVDDIMGYRISKNAPQLAVFDGDPSDSGSKKLTTGASWDFGSSVEPTSHIFYLKNIGTGILTVSSISTPEGFEMKVDTLRLGADETTRATLTMVAGVEPFGAKSGIVRLELTDLDPFELSVKGYNRNPSTFFVDFEDGRYPSGWFIGEGWNIAESYGTQNHCASNQYQEATALVTPMLEVSEGDSLCLDAKCYGLRDWYPPTLRVSYSADRVVWDSIADWTDVLASSFTRYTLREIPAGRWYVRFEGRNVELDNLEGFRLAATAEHDVVFSAIDLPEEATVNHPYTAQVSVVNLGTADETLTATMICGTDSVAVMQSPALRPDSVQTFVLTFVPHEEHPSAPLLVSIQTDSGLHLQTDSLQIAIQPETENSLSRQLTGRLTDEEGFPVAGATLRMQSGDVQYEGQSNEQGDFELTICQGTLDYILTISHQDCDMLTDSVVFHYEDIDTTYVMHRLVPLAITSSRMAQDSSQTIFDLQGRRLHQEAQKLSGIYIINRRKVLIK